MRAVILVVIKVLLHYRTYVKIAFFVFNVVYVLDAHNTHVTKDRH